MMMKVGIGKKQPIFLAFLLCIYVCVSILWMEPFTGAGLRR